MILDAPLFFKVDFSSRNKEEKAIVVHAQGPPWDYKAFDKFDFALIGHFESDSKALKAISRFEHLYYDAAASHCRCHCHRGGKTDQRTSSSHNWTFAHRL